MKKYLIIFLSVLLFCGCNNKEDEYLKTYNNYIDEVKKIDKTSEDIPFDINLEFDRLTDKEVRYQVIIDNVKEDITDVEAVMYHDLKTDDIFPSIGIFDEKESLKVGQKPAGIILVGYIDYTGDINELKCNIKVLVKYKDSNNKNKKIYYVIKK